MMDMCFPSCTPRCTTVFLVPSMLTLSVSAPVRTGGTGSPRSVSGAGTTARGLDRVARPVPAALVLLVVRLLAPVPFLVPLLPVSSWECFVRDMRQP